MMLHNESRELVVEAYEKTHDAKRVSEDFNICERTVSKLVAQKRKTGTVELRLHTRGRKKKLTEEDLAAIRKLIEEHYDITINEIRDILHLTASYSTVERAVRAMGFRLKKKLSMQASVTVIDVEEEHKNWTESSKGIEIEHLVFLDES